MTYTPAFLIKQPSILYNSRTELLLKNTDKMLKLTLRKILS